MRLLLSLLARQRGHLFPWAAVFYGCGIGIYFALRTEPSALHYLILIAVLGAVMVGLTRCGENLAPLLVAVLMLLLGGLVAGIHAHLAKAPVLGFRYYGPVEGRIVTIDRSWSDKIRLTLDQVVLHRTDPSRTPLRARLSLHGQQGFFTPEPGARVVLTGHLSPPQGPAEPGGFDFRRTAWFERIGAVGYTRTPALRLSPPEAGARLWLARLRHRMAEAIRSRIGGDTGAFAAAITTGDRSGISRGTLEALRASNLAHLLAISGLHMGLLTGFVFAALRYGLALVPVIALRWPTKKLAALVALAAGGGYLALSGGNVATVRAFVMVSVVLIAVLLDRRALTLRVVAIAALIVLSLDPQELTGPGFQMSFAATTALIAAFGAVRAVRWPALRGPVRAVAAAIISSAVAGLATAPFAAAHFNQIAHYGLMANIAAVPVMGLVTMPAAVLAALLWPVGLENIGLGIMEIGIRWILAVSVYVAGLEGALGHVRAPGGMVLPLLSLGALFVMLWGGPARFLGVVAVALSLVLWRATDRPDVLIAATGGLVGVTGPEGRALSKPRGEGFVAGIWLENDGAPADQAEAHQRPAFTGDDGVPAAQVAGQVFFHLHRKRHAERARHLCREGAWLISPLPLEGGGGPCRVLDAPRLRQSGSVAVFAGRDGVRVRTTAGHSGTRLWTVPSGQ